MSRGTGQLSSDSAVLAREYGVHYRQILNFGEERFQAMTEDARRVMLNAMKRSQTTMSKRWRKVSE